ncbi:MAG: DUF4430 domain-containing protein [Clostridia bacterium]|nr:DUF4430 domain-containing protein [Clostridia bacterium]
MKKIKIFALVLAIAMLSACLISCGTQKIKVEAKVGVYVGEEFLLNPFSVTVQGVEAPTILQAVREALELNGIEYESDEMGIKSIAGNAYKNDGKTTCFWTYTINGEEPSSGRAGNTAINEGDTIIYVYQQESNEDLAEAGSKAE